MLDLKKLFALGAVCTMGLVACDVEEDANGDAGLTCTAGDATVDPICASDDAGVETCVCPGGTGGVQADMGMGGDTGGAEPPADPTVSLAWDGDNIELKVVTSAENGPYLFGLAETGNGDAGWYGEDCIDGISNDTDVCHSVPENGELTLVHVAAPADVVDGKTLVNAGLADGLTYVLIRDTAEFQGCWTWGHNTSFYKDPPLGCNEITPVAP